MGPVERAFELARSGECNEVDQIRTRLKREGHGNVDAHLSGSLAKQLRELMRSSRTA